MRDSLGMLAINVPLRTCKVVGFRQLLPVREGETDEAKNHENDCHKTCGC